jgi:flagellar hook-associated protein 1 FlgK
MVTMNSILNINARGLEAAKAGLDVTGQNIANANTDGYSRQRVVQQATNPLVLPQGIFGQGVEIVSVERIRDMFLEGQIRGVQSDKAFNEELDRLFLRMEAVLSDPLAPVGTDDATDLGGINNLLSRFFQSLNDLSATPDRPETRQAVIDNGLSLATTFNFASEELNTIKSDLNERVVLLTEDVNRKSAEIAALNQRIAITEVGGKTSNDLRDQRDRLLSQLSEIIPISTADGGNGMIDVTLTGQRIVDGVESTAVQVEFKDQPDGTSSANLRIGSSGLYVQDDLIRKGKLGAVLDARDRIVPYMINEINTLSRGIIYEINKIHSASAGLEGLERVTSSYTTPTKDTGDLSGHTLEKIFNSNSEKTNIASRLRTFPVENGEFSIRVTDDENNTRDIFDVNVSTMNTLEEIVDRIDRSDGVVKRAQSALTFDPVFVRRATAETGVSVNELTSLMFSLSALDGTPLSENPPTQQSFEIHVKNKGGSLIDNNTSTTAIEPITINFSGLQSLQQLVSTIQSQSNGLVRAAVVPSANDPDISVLQIETVNSDFSLSIQNDTSGIIKAFEFPITDPNIPLIGGTTTQAAAVFSQTANSDIFGSGTPSFSPNFPGPPPSVIEPGTFEMVVLDNNNVPTISRFTLAPNGVNTLNELRLQIQNANPNIDITITPDNRFLITAENQRSFFFQNDTTGLIKAMGFDEINGFGQVGSDNFIDGSFEIIVADERGTVQNIVEVPVLADPSSVGGVVSLNDVIQGINSAAGNAAAPIRASIVASPDDPSRFVIQIESDDGYEFTFRSDDSFLLSALGFTDGPVLTTTNNPPISGGAEVVAVGDNIGAIVRASISQNNDIQIYTTANERITFTGDSSHFLAAAGINSFFQGSDARTMRVNNEILNNTNLFAASGDGNPGNNEAAQAMAELETERVINNKTFSETFRSTVATLGVEGGRAKQFLETNTSILRELEVLREQESGVSLDEESINLIKFQQAFQASARMINTIDQLMDTIINQIGR